jgi:hypothetical protein
MSNGFDKEISSTKDIMLSDQNEKYSEISNYLSGKFSEYKNKRKETEYKWLRNQRQYDGKYEPEVLKSIQPGRCSLYNPVTTKKVNEFKSRMFELVIPDGDRNFGIKIDNNPSLSKEDTDLILEKLNERQKQSYQQYMQAIQSGQQPPELFEVTEDIIKEEIKNLALTRAKNMEDTIVDQLVDCGYTEIMSKVIFSGAIYGTGVIRGPYYIAEDKIKFYTDEFGNWTSKKVTVGRPYIEYCKVWDFFPDMDAKSQDVMDGAFFYHTMTKQDLVSLSKRDDFLGENIKDYISLNKKGNFVYEWYETALYSSGKERALYENNKYRVVEYWGSVPAYMCKDIFDDIEEDQELVEVNVWMIDNIIIKCIKNPYESGRRPFRFYNFQSTEAQLLGYGVTDLIEELQAGLNAVHRAIHDNIAYIAGPIIEMNEELIPAGQKIDRLFPGQIIHRIGIGQEAQARVLQDIQVNSHIGELMEMYNTYLEAIDDVTSIKAIMSGDMTGQATLGRSASGISQIMGAAAIVLRDLAKQFDFFNQPIIEMFVEWNMMFNDDKNIKGDHKVYARVSTEIIDKELKSQYLSNMIMQMAPEQREYVNWKGLLKKQLLMKNIDPDTVLLTDDEYKTLQSNKQAQMSQEQAIQQQIAQQRIQNETLKIQSDANLKQAKIYEIQNKTDIAKSKDQLDHIKALAQVNKDNKLAEQKDNELKYKVFNDELNRSEDFIGKMMDSKSQDNKYKNNGENQSENNGENK